MLLLRCSRETALSSQFTVHSLGTRIQRGFFLTAFLCIVSAFVLAGVTTEPQVPSFQEVQAAYHPSDVPLSDRFGEVIHELRVDMLGRRLPWTPLSEVSPALQAAVITSEDRRFSRHGGVDGMALTSAALNWLRGKPLRGASTISMQVTTLLSSDVRSAKGQKALGQKWRQMRLAWALERHWSKSEILEAYVNLVTFRGEVQGVAAAAHVLFGKAPHGITAAEATVLAVLLRAPNAGQEAVTRRVWALQEAQGQTAMPEETSATVTLAFHNYSSPSPRVALAPHAARRLLQPATTLAPVRSTLHGALQRFAIETLRRHLLAVQAQQVKDGAVLVVENATGEVLVYVGGSGDLSRTRYVDGIQARRQAGSTLKPFLYGLALERRLLTPASLLEDTPLNLPVIGGLYRPQNYDEQFRGPVSVRTALASSLNIPAVRTLALVGTEPFVQQLRELGFAGLTESGGYYGPALALGSADVSLWKQVNAYRTLANGGVWSPLKMRPEPVSGFEFQVSGSQSPASSLQPPVSTPHSSLCTPQFGERLYSEETTFLVSHILADRESRSATFGLENPLATRFWSAVKTGTSKDMRDNWCIGFSRRYTVGVWVGNFSGEPMRDVSGVTGAAPVWLEIMERLHQETPSLPPPPPRGVLVKRVAFPQNMEPTRMEWFLTGTEPHVSALTLALSSPRILAPAAGTVIALDPDIPRLLQQVIFKARTHGSQFRWRLDGADLGTAAEVQLWEPEPGSHTLSLVDEQQRLIDTVEFTVRGSRVAGAAE
jgi:penicillin-binding protein 1C